MDNVSVVMLESYVLLREEESGIEVSSSDS